MAVWFRHGSCTVGLDDGVVRSADFASLTSLLQALDAVAHDRVRILEDAQADAQRLLAAARAQAEALLADARERHDRAQQEGVEQGLQDASAQWVAHALDEAAINRRRLQRQREQLSEIVSMAVERMVGQEDRQALYQRALHTISKLVRDVPMLTLRVHHDDHEAARQALQALGSRSGDLPIEVVADAAMSEGGCRFESDHGVIDASLETQLAAVKRAVVRAAQAVVGADAAPADDVRHDEAQDAAVS